ncbi:dihydropteroate synthase [Haloparvum sp. PAK95]|uniref:dihydropteroate synthase n=1 Tax=Haloparvum sp. PAK95 TaxID=3418962 RepID=UPI003D2EC0F5
MRYHEAANFLFDLRRFSVKLGTESVEALLDHLGNPGEDVDFLQIAGSNGKGSTARMTESILREAGLSVGLYTSPHLTDLSERVRVDGHPMSDDAIAEFVAEVKPWLVDRAADGNPLTFFEVVTAMGIWQFARRDVDVAVLEVGMGGEYDATSAVDPAVTAITNVSLEHTSVLGDTIEEIARTKAAIAAGGTPMVTACGGEALDVVSEVVEDAGSDLTTVDGPGVVDPRTDADVHASYEGRLSPTDASIALHGPDWDYDARIPLVGEFQATNAGVAVAVARRAAEELDADAFADGSLPDDAARDGLARAHWPGRFEVLGTEPYVVLDGAHNPAACATLSDTLSTYEYDDLHLVFAAMHDKDHAGSVEGLPTPDAVYTCEPDLERAEDPDVLATVFEEAGVDDVHTGASVQGALRRARERAGPDDCVLLTGSLFAVAEARATYTRQFVPKDVGGIDEAAATLDDADVSPPGIRHMRGKLDHRVVKTRLEPRQANYCKQQLLALGGECAVSGIDAGGELVDVVMAATMSEFQQFVDALDDQPYGLPEVGERLRRELGIRVADDEARSGTKRATEYPWTDGTAIMGILNVTPDSFHDGGRHEAFEDAVVGVERMVEAGADVIDVGGESTRPGAEVVPVEEEIERVVPVVEATQEVDAVADDEVLVSVDTRKPEVAAAALEAGADVINDVTGLENPEMREVVAEHGCPVVVMHSLEAPVNPDHEIEYEDVVEDVLAVLEERLLLAETAGIPRENVIVDPGLGFGKSPAEDFELLGRVDEFAALGCPVLVGHSHKSFLGGVDCDPAERKHATVAGTAVAVEHGADIVRVHDVAENRAAVDVVEAATDPELVDEG